MTNAIKGGGWVLATALLGLVSCHGHPLTSNVRRDASVSDGLVAEAPAPAAMVIAVVAPRMQPPSVARDCIDSTKCSWWQEPDPSARCCDGLCTNLANDPWNCGDCGVVCGAAQICANATCGAPQVPLAPDASASDASADSGSNGRADCTTIACVAGQICCGGQCVVPSVDRSNCGGCGVECRFEGASCLAGGCCSGAVPDAPCRTRACPNGRVFCDPACKDLGVDPDNCGACGAVCPAAARTCVAGVCLSR